MSLCAYSNSLADLAVASLGEYVSDLFVRMVTFPKYNATEDFKQRYIKETCKRLEKRICTTIPPILANEITAKLLYYLTKSYSEVRESEYKYWIFEVIDPLVGAILHPSLTTLQYCEKWSNTDLRYKELWSDMFYFIRDYDHKLTNIKALDWDFTPFGSLCHNSNIWQNLEFFRCRKYCDNDLLKSLASNCSRLKSIDVSYSLGVTDESVESLLEFKHLVKLNVLGTGISELGQSRLLIGSSHIEVHSSGKAQGVGVKISNMSKKSKYEEIGAIRHRIILRRGVAQGLIQNGPHMTGAKHYREYRAWVRSLLLSSINRSPRNHFHP